MSGKKSLGQSIEWLKRFPSATIKGKAIYDYFVFKGQSIWDVFPSHIASTVIAEYKTQETTKSSSSLKFVAFIKLSAIIKDIFNIICKASQLSKKSKQNKTINLVSKKPYILFVSHSMYWKKEKIGYKKQYVLGELIEKYAGQYSIVGVETPYLFDDRSLDRLNNKDINWVLQSHFFSTKIVLKAFGLYAKLFFSILGFIFNPNSIKGISKESLSVYKANRFFFYRIFFTRSFEFILYYLLSERMIDEIKPKFVCLLYETGPYERAIIRACQQKDIPTFGFMHGIIHPCHPDYNKQFRSIKEAMIPDITFVWGDFAKKIMCNNHAYPQSQVVVVGNLSIEPAQQKNNSNLPAFNSVKKHIGVISCSYPYLDYTEDVAYTYHLPLYKYAYEHPDIGLIIKLHPGEPIAIHEKLKKQYSSDNIFYSRDINLEDFFLKVDVVIGIFFSTVLYEALRSKKPILCLSYSGMFDDADFFLESEGILLIEKPDQLIIQLEEVMKGNTNFYNKEKVKDFLHQHLYQSNIHPADLAYKIIQQKINPI